MDPYIPGLSYRSWLGQTPRHEVSEHAINSMFDASMFDHFVLEWLAIPGAVVGVPGSIRWIVFIQSRGEASSGHMHNPEKGVYPCGKKYGTPLIQSFDNT